MRSIDLHTDKLIVFSASKIISNLCVPYFIVLPKEHHDS
jgi:hypothetical protein